MEDYVSKTSELLHLEPCGHSGAEMVYICPFCGKKKLYMSRNKGVFFCFHCGRGWNFPQLYAEMNGITVEEALHCISEGTQGRSFEMPDTYLPKEKEMAGIKKRDAFYRAFLNHLTLSEKDRKDLQNRGFSEREIAGYGFKSTPRDYEAAKEATALSIRETGMTPDGVPGFFERKGVWTCAKPKAGYFIPVLDFMGRVQSMQFRLQNPPIDENGKPEGKYKAFSSAGRHNGTSASNFIHYAFGWERENGVLLPRIRSRQVYVTEGYLKADLAHAAGNDKGWKFDFLAVAGINSIGRLGKELCYLKKRGVEEVVNAYDMDEFDCEGKEGNEAVQKGSTHLERIVRDCGLKYRRVRWNPDYKGIDDLIAAKTRTGSGA